jgi:hypothetical protein
MHVLNCTAVPINFHTFIAKTKTSYNGANFFIRRLYLFVSCHATNISTSPLFLKLWLQKFGFFARNRSPDQDCMRCVQRFFSYKIIRRVNLSDRLSYMYVGLDVKL